MVQVAQLEQDQRPALILGEPRQIADQLAQLGTPLDVVGQSVGARLEVVGRQGGVTTPGKHRAAAIARDREQPRPHRVRQPTLAQRMMSAQEGLLQRVLAVLAVAEHVAAEREQRRVVAVIERFERVLIAFAHERGEAGVVEPPKPASSCAMPCEAAHVRLDALGGLFIE